MRTIRKAALARYQTAGSEEPWKLSASLIVISFMPHPISGVNDKNTNYVIISMA
ncbi:hypothetical protein [Rhizobium sp. BK176]|uniref:hypothetical protein n=1 Tax=Rhizobium sp. BK176 TaxID=2587071 RepID=UPI0021693E49|nr:hypothetical protein [Rhizobium sp. BK176]MCS4089542.1 hypothetical protein [Rhizobium sp. BK176]